MEDLTGRMLGEFVLREPLAEGGYAVVYRAEQPVLKRDVVVKVLRARRQRNDAALDRFLREARLASQLDHPYAAHVYAFGTEDDGLLWIAMELIHGVTLGAWLERHGPMSLEQFVPFFEHVAQVVHAAHERGIVHRDLKPSNVMVIERGGRLLPKLLDLGIAKVENERASAAAVSAEPWAPRGDDEDGAATAQIRPPQSAHRTATDPDHGHKLTRTGVRMGSAPYMPPEQWADAGAVGPATDIYSLGILAYEALTGRRPFRADSTKDYYWRHLRAEIPPLGDDFSPALDRILRRAVAKNPADRHGSVLELATDLRALLQAQPREQIRSLAQVWDARARSPALLLQSRDLLREQTGVVGDLERTFMTTSQRHASRRAHLRRLLAVSAGALALSAVWYRGQLETEMAERVAEASITQSELEQGRSALLHGEPGAAPHLARSYRRDPRPTTAFMLARAIEPRLAEQARLPSSFGRMWSAAFSPDSKQLVTTDDKNAQIWDAQTYRLRFTLPHGETVYHATYSRESSTLVTAGGDGSVRIWNTSSGVLVRELQHKNEKPRYRAVALRTDDKVVAAIDIAGAAVHVWNAETGELLASLRCDASKFPSLSFSSDGHWLAASGGSDLRIFDTRTWSQVLEIPNVHRMAWSPTAPHLVTGSSKGAVAIWEIPSGKSIHLFQELGESIDAIAFSVNGQLVAAADEEGTENVWEAESGKLRNRANFLHTKVRSVEFDATSTLVVTAGSEGTLVVTDASSGALVSTLDGFRNTAMTARFDPASRRVLSASWEGTAKVWDVKSQYRQWSAPSMVDDCGVGLPGLEPDSRFLAIGCSDQPTRIWDTAHDKLLAELPSVTRNRDGSVSAYPAISAAGDRVAIARDNTAEIYDVPGAHLRYIVKHAATVNVVAFARTGRDLVSGAMDGSLLVTRASGAQLAFPASDASIDAVAFLNDGRVVSLDARRHLRIYDITGTIIAGLETSTRAGVLRASSDDHRLLTVPMLAGKAGAPELWNLDTYRLIARMEAPGQGQVYGARFVPAGRILTTSGDGSARLWDAADGRLLQRYEGSPRFLADGTLSTDGSMVIAGGGDGLLRFWELASGRPLWVMPAHKSNLVGVHVDGESIVTRGFSGNVVRWTLPKPEQIMQRCSMQERCAMVFQ